MCRRLTLFLALFILGVFGKISAQQYTFHSYSLEDGLSHPFIYSINTDVNGYLWFATGEGLCRFDGFQFERNQQVDSLSDGFVNCSYKDAKGNLWFGHNSGDVTFFDGLEFVHANIGVPIKGTINAIVGDGQKYIYLVSQNSGIIRMTQHFKADTCSGDINAKMLYSMIFIQPDKALIASGEGIAFYQVDGLTLTMHKAIEELAYIKVQTILQAGDGIYWLGTEDMGLWKLEVQNPQTGAYSIKQMGNDEAFLYANIQDLSYDNKGNLWVATMGNGAYKIPVEQFQLHFDKSIHYTTENGLVNNFVKSLLLDWENNMWLGTYGGGVDMSSGEAFTFHFSDIEQGNVTALAQNKQGTWFAFGSKLYLQKEGEPNPVPVAVGLPKVSITSLYADTQDNLWIGSATKGVFLLKDKARSAIRVFHSANSLTNAINHITGNGNVCYFSTKNGVVLYDQKTQGFELYNTSTGLPHNNIKSTFVDEQGNVWVATSNNGIFTLDLSKELLIEGNYKLEFTSITQDTEGSLWAATYGDGVFHFVEDTLQYFSEDSGLKSNYCYAIGIDDQDNVWVGHRLGLSAIGGATNSVQVIGKEDGIKGDINPNAILALKDQRLLFGTTRGAIAFSPANWQKNIIPPKLHVEDVRFSGKSVKVDDDLVVPFGYYKMEVDFVALSYRKADQVTYEYMLEGYDFEWMPKRQGRTIVYPRLGDGEYTLKIKACNADGVCVEEPLLMNIKVMPPLWKRWWFITLMFVLLVGAVYLIIAYRERRQKALQAYLEAELAQRTKEVLEQRDLLERKNRDITDSINYAKRIQKSILPSTQTLDTLFEGMFVFYKPRDIVSGDFYWFDRINENKLLIICADSTGHGVPGAFMSMIGTTLIKDICNRPDIMSPAAVLHQLDHELQGTLNQNLDAEKAHDGMDIIVCELDVHTNYMRFASAMRPIIIYKDNQLQYVKGSKCSIGGEAEDTKKFENVGFQLSKGDIIYMFSDGYPDQFGGPRNKKYKMARLKNMLAEVCEYPMGQQHDVVQNSFEEWKGNNAQVDDVLFMGVKL